MICFKHKIIIMRINNIYQIVAISFTGIGFARYDDTFKKYHKLCLAILKEFGFGVKTVSEIRIIRQVQLLKQKFQNFNGHPIDPNSLALESTFSVVSSILFGETFAASDTCHRI